MAKKAKNPKNGQKHQKWARGTKTPPKIPSCPVKNNPFLEIFELISL
jgi:hypothetical protein